MGKRFKALRGKVRKLIVDEDCFGLTNKDYKVTIMARFDFPRNADKIDAFMQWFNEQAAKDLLSFGKMKQIGTGIERAWTDIYIIDSYKRGVLRAKSEMTKEKFERPKIWDTGGIDAVMSMPIHLDRVGVVATRAFSELKGITSSMDSQISKVLAQGLIDGDNPLLLARKLTKTISGPFEDLGITDAAGRFIPAERRARTLARTEIIRAHHQGNVQEMENWGAVGVKVKAEFMTAGYHVCPECEGLQGKIFTLEQIRSMIPVHPNCRCVALPVKEKEEKKPAKGKIPIPKGGSLEARSLISPALDMAPCLISTSLMGNLSLYARPSSCVDFYMHEGKWYHKGELLPEAELERINKLSIPPGWKNVVVSADKSARIQAIGQDTAGRWQYRYSAEHIKENEMAKFTRSRNFARDISGIRSKVDANINKGDPCAFLLRLEDKTAIRVGSAKDFKAKTKAYGLTTLQHEHVTIRGDTIVLEFTAKEGIQQKYILNDPVLAPFISERKAATVEGQALFPDVSASKLNKYLKDISGNNYTVKDFRTYHGTRIAHDELQQYLGKTFTKKEKQKIVKEVSTKASEYLHNTPTMALQSYIDPMVWEIIGGIE